MYKRNLDSAEDVIELVGTFIKLSSCSQRSFRTCIENFYGHS